MHYQYMVHRHAKSVVREGTAILRSQWLYWVDSQRRDSTGRRLSHGVVVAELECTTVLRYML